MIKRFMLVAIVAAIWPVPMAFAQDSAQPAGDRISREARRFGVGVQGGVGIDPELIDLGVHATFGPVFKPNLVFRPALEVGAGEITTFLGKAREVKPCPPA